MDNNSASKLLLLIVGTLAGIVSTLIASAYKSYLDRQAELRKSRAQMQHDYLDPLRISAQDLRGSFLRSFKQVTSEKEKDIAEAKLKPDYTLRYWFLRNRNYIMDANDDWTDEERRRDFAMNSGGIGCEAASTLYQTACYLYHATRIRRNNPYVQLGKDDQELIARIDDVRAKFSQLNFYSVTQDSTGVSMRNAAGEVRNYREFGETITSKSERAWFRTLADVFCQLHTHTAENVGAFVTSLDRLITFLARSLPS